MAKKICFGCMKQYDDNYEICPYCGYIEGTGPKEPYHLYPGTVLQGKYIVGKTIGYGGFGVTYIGYDYALGHKIAIKEYLPGEFSTRCSGEKTVAVFDGEKGEQFKNGVGKFVDEAKKLAAFKAIEGIVTVFDCFEENNTAYIVMEYLEGCTLKEILEQEGKMDFDRAVEYIVPILDALIQVHSVGLLHRDISPDNIFVTNDGRVKLIDFGAARYASSSHSKSLSVIVKPGYAPQEQYRSRGDQGPWSDVYACAATLYKMITGITPQDSMERGMADKLVLPRKLGVKIPKDKQNALMNALNLNIEKRTKSAEEFKENLLKGSKRVSGGKKITILPTWPLWLKIVSGIGAAAVITAIAMIIRWVVVPPKPIITDGIRVPYVVGKTIEEAEKIITDAGLLFQITDKLEDDNIPKGYVLSQNKNAGDKIARNTAIEVTVSAGGKVIYMGNYIGMEASAGKSDLDSLGLNYITLEGESEIAPGYIYDQSILPDTEVNKGSEVTLSVSTGISTYDAAKTTKVPQLVGKSWEDGRKTVRNSNLYIRLIGTEYSMTIPKGQIFEQSPLADENANEGDVVDVKISLGIMTVRVPDVQFKDKDEAKDTLEALGLKVIMTEEESNAVANNHVIRQSIEPGTEIEVTTDGKHTEITIVISKGIKGIDLEVAKRSIENAGLNVGKISYTETDKKDKNNKVSKQSPESGEKVDPGSTVDLVVYQYKGTTEDDKAEVEVPNVVGKNENDAKTMINSAGLNVDGINRKETTDKSLDGKVASQSPSAGTKVEKNTGVVITVYTFKNADETVKVKVPDVVGKRESQAIALLEDKKLSVGNITYKNSTNKSEAGKVATQSPAAGKEVTEGTSVDLVIYRYKVEVPDVVGKSENDAKKAITGAGLKVANVEYIDTTNSDQDGKVVSQSPASGTLVNEGAEVNLTVYKMNKVTVPNVVGKIENDAKNSIKSAGLSVGTVSYKTTNDKAKDGMVASQSPTSGTKVQKGTSIDLTIYKYEYVEQLVEVPNVVGLNEDNATTKLEKLNLVVNVKTTTCNKKTDDGKVKSQNPAAGKKVSEGSTVEIVVYKFSGITVPNVVGLDHDTAYQKIIDKGLYVKVIYEKTTNKSDDGKVKSQNPTAGTVVEIESQVTITVYTHEPPPPVVVPDLVGLTKNEAIQALKNKGLSFGNVSEEKGLKANQDGKIQKQNPAAGASVEQGTAVDFTVYVFVGTEVPDLYGKTYQDALKALEDKGLNVGTVTYKHDSSKTDGNVMSQGTSAGSIVDKGSYVSLVVCDNTQITYYRYKSVTDYETKTTTTRGSLGADWEYVSEKTDTSYSAWSPWSEWSTTNPGPESDVMEVRTRVIPAKYQTQYNYSKYASNADGTGWSGPYEAYWSGYYCWKYVERGWSTDKLDLYTWSDDIPLYGWSGNTWYNETSRQVKISNEYTEYSYRTRTKTVTTTYTYRKPNWSSWSSWSKDYISETSTRKVESKTIYWDETP